MKIGFLSDIHGNKYALEKCYNFLLNSGVDEIYFLGDAVGYYPYSIDVLLFLKESGITCLMGNHEAMLLGLLDYPLERDEIYQLNAVKAELTYSLETFIRSFFLFKEIQFGERKILMIHGSPVNPLCGYIYPDSDIGEFEHLSFDFIFMAHTHIPFVKKFFGKTIVNIGSCGLPRDNGNYSSVAIFDCLENEVKVFRLKMELNVYTDYLMRQAHRSVRSLFERDTLNIFGEILD